MESGAQGTWIRVMQTRLARWVDDQKDKVHSAKQFCLILSMVGSHCTRTDMMTIEL